MYTEGKRSPEIIKQVHIIGGLLLFITSAIKSNEKTSSDVIIKHRFKKS